MQREREYKPEACHSLARGSRITQLNVIQPNNVSNVNTAADVIFMETNISGYCYMFPLPQPC